MSKYGGHIPGPSKPPPPPRSVKGEVLKAEPDLRLDELIEQNKKLLGRVGDLEVELHKLNRCIIREMRQLREQLVAMI